MAKRVVIAGGGTGGHLFPGIALAHAFRKHDMNIEVTFVGTRKGIESKVVPREGFDLKTIQSSGLLGKKGLSRWVSWCKLPMGIAQSLCLLMQKRPSLVVGVGGYASAPVVVSAWVLRIPILIQEQNVIPGTANKWLGRIADKVAVSFEESKKFFPAGRAVKTGNMIREELCVPREELPERPRDKFYVLVLGGSQGAHSINMAMLEALEPLASVKERLHIVHQTGERDFERVRKGYEEQGFSAEVHPFIDDMAAEYQRASLVICRAGATTLAEITACGRASVLVPYPHAAHRHQEHNARVLEEAQAGEVLLDEDLNGEKLARSILWGIENPDELEKRENNSYQLGTRDAAEKVRQLCLELMTKTPGASPSGENIQRSYV